MGEFAGRASEFRRTGLSRGGEQDSSPYEGSDVRRGGEQDSSPYEG